MQAEGGSYLAAAEVPEEVQQVLLGHFDLLLTRQQQQQQLEAEGQEEPGAGSGTAAAAALSRAQLRAVVGLARLAMGFDRTRLEKASAGAAPALGHRRIGSRRWRTSPWRGGGAPPLLAAP